jgi:hypothetical protein
LAIKAIGWGAMVPLFLNTMKLSFGFDFSRDILKKIFCLCQDLSIH